MVKPSLYIDPECLALTLAQAGLVMGVKPGSVALGLSQGFEHQALAFPEREPVLSRALYPICRGEERGFGWLTGGLWQSHVAFNKVELRSNHQSTDFKVLHELAFASMLQGGQDLFQVAFHDLGQFVQGQIDAVVTQSPLGKVVGSNSV